MLGEVHSAPVWYPIFSYYRMPFLACPTSFPREFRDTCAQRDAARIGSQICGGRSPESCANKGLRAAQAAVASGQRERIRSRPVPVSKQLGTPPLIGSSVVGHCPPKNTGRSGMVSVATDCGQLRRRTESGAAGKTDRKHREPVASPPGSLLRTVRGPYWRLPRHSTNGTVEALAFKQYCAIAGTFPVPGQVLAGRTSGPSCRYQRAAGRERYRRATDCGAAVLHASAFLKTVAVSGTYSGRGRQCVEISADPSRCHHRDDSRTGMAFRPQYGVSSISGIPARFLPGLRG